MTTFIVGIVTLLLFQICRSSRINKGTDGQWQKTSVLVRILRSSESRSGVVRTSFVGSWCCCQPRVRKPQPVSWCDGAESVSCVTWTFYLYEYCSASVFILQCLSRCSPYFTRLEDPLSYLITEVNTLYPLLFLSVGSVTAGWVLHVFLTSNISSVRRLIRTSSHHWSRVSMYNTWRQHVCTC